MHYTQTELAARLDKAIRVTPMEIAGRFFEALALLSLILMAMLWPLIQ